MAPPPAVVHHPAVPVAGGLPRGRRFPGRLSREERLALAVRLLGAGVLLLEAELWPTVAGVRSAGLDAGGGLCLGRGPVSLDGVLRRVGGGHGGFHRICAAFARAVCHRLQLPPLDPMPGHWGLGGWLEAAVGMLPRPLPAVAAEALWAVAVKPLPEPEEGEVHCWRVEHEALAYRLGRELVGRLRRSERVAWLLEAGRQEGSTAPRPPVGARGVLVVAGPVTEEDVAAAERWAEAAGCASVVVGGLPPGWQGADVPAPAVPGGAVLLAGGTADHRAAALAAAGRGADLPDRAGRRTLNLRARRLWEPPADGEDGGAGGVERVLALRREGLPEGVVCLLAGVSPQELERMETRGGLVRVEGGWRLVDPPALGSDPLHLEVAALFDPDSPEALLHRTLGGDGAVPLLRWAEGRLDDLDGGSVRRLLLGVAPGALGGEVSLLLAQACLLEADGIGADRALEVADGPGRTAVDAWRWALDRSSGWDPRPLNEDEVAAAPLAAAAAAVFAWRREVRRGRPGAPWAEQADRAAKHLSGAASRWLALHRLSLTRPEALSAEGRELAGGHRRLRREWLQLRALEARERGRLRAARRALRALVRAGDPAVGPGERGLLLLDLGSLEIFLGRSGEADRIHLRALRLLEAAGLPGRAEVAAFNLAVSEIDRLELDAAASRLEPMVRVPEDPFVTAELARLALARGDLERCRDLTRRLAGLSGAAALEEARSLLEGVLDLFDGERGRARERLRAGGVEGRGWLCLLDAVEGRRPADPPGDGWGVGRAAALLAGETAPPGTGSGRPGGLPEALALALAARLVPGRVQAAPWETAAAEEMLLAAGMGGWAEVLRAARGSGRFLEALAWIAETGTLQGLPPVLEGELLSGLGVTGLVIRREGAGVEMGEGEPQAGLLRGGMEVIPLGRPAGETPEWRLLLHLLDGTGLAARASAPGPVPGLVGSSAPMEEVRRDLLELAPTRFPVLITGETGTGKELAARALHTLSGRRGRFVALNVAAVPENLVETELFGSVKGAFTGAEARQGLAAAAEGGTLFLDEIGELEPRVQAKLLRFLETSEVRPVGSTRPRRVDVRIVSATHQDLERLVAEGRFRRDLFYRIATATVRMPALRERLEDIPELVAELAGRLVARGEVPPASWTPAALARLSRHAWPGNVRELAHTVAVSLTRARGRPVRAQDLPLAAGDGRLQGPATWAAALDGLRARLITEALQRSGGNRTAAARELGITRQTLLYHMGRLGIGA